MYGFYGDDIDFMVFGVMIKMYVFLCDDNDFMGFVVMIKSVRVLW
jgi:hypothetical protein